MNVHKITPQCYCERLIMVVLSKCHCISHMSKLSVFNRLSTSSPSNLVKRRHPYKKRLFPKVEYLDVTFNMVIPSTTPSKSKRKQLAISSEESDVEPSSGLKEILIEPEGIYQCTRIRTGTIAPVDYNILARGIEASDEHSAIAESQSSNSYMEKDILTYMAETPEEMAKRYQEQARV